MPEVKVNLIHPQVKVNSVERGKTVTIYAEFIGQPQCPICSGTELRTKDFIERKVRHESVGVSNTWLYLKLRKYQCLKCGRYFRARVPGLLPYPKSTEMFRKEIFHNHKDGISQKQLKENRQIGSATIERWFHDLLIKTERNLSGRECPRVLGIDEHFLTKKDGYVTTLCDLEKHKVFKFSKGPIREVSGQCFLNTWQLLDPIGRKNRGLLSLMRRKSENLKPEQKLRLQLYLKEHPALEIIYEAKQSICVNY